ncbi:Dephospho-CoA kinase [Nesidiocoris tenuis]|uniref:Dephospho-CoA kinase n=1 Tax=Nesidiocoris tenuis TaxID=355587 RepID=A0ABN7B6U3_9HEMI|nr:Dephospho-CoA kinase [Nesidiocoris tenuis]
MYLIGLTGSIGSGKSTVAKMLIERNIPVVDADFYARKVVEPGKPAWKKIKANFGEDVFKENGELDRTRLGQIIFEDKAKRRLLNEITHPEIYKEIFKVCVLHFFQGRPYVVLDLPLLFEHGALVGYMHKIIVVTCERDQQIQRLRSRDNMDEASAVLRVQSQWSMEEKAKRANFVIDNAGTVDETKEQVEKMMAIIEDDNFHIRIRVCIAVAAGLICGFFYFVFLSS